MVVGESDFWNEFMGTHSVLVLNHISFISGLSFIALVDIIEPTQTKTADW